MDEKEKDTVILRTYRPVWKFQRKIYSIGNIKLLIPVNPDELLYFIVSVGLIWGLIKIVPILGGIPFAFKAAAAYGVMKFITKQKLDGKFPHKFFLDYIIYKLSQKKYEHFKAVASYGKIKFVTPIVGRDIELINKTEIALGKSSKKSTVKKKNSKKMKNGRIKKFMGKGA